MSVFVAGGTGFIGAEVVRRLVAEGRHVQVLTRSEKGEALARSLGAEAVRGDLLEPGPWQEVAREADHILHLAQPATFGARVTKERAEAYRGDRLTMDQALLSALDPHHTQKIIYVGGTSYYGNLGTTLRDETATPMPRGWGPYVAPAIEAIGGYLAQGLPIVTAFPGYVSMRSYFLR